MNRKTYLIILIAILPGRYCLSQQPLVKRDLTLIENRKIVSYNVNQIQLDDGTILTWDQVLTAPVADKKFEELHAALSMPLFRMKHRWSIGDYVAAAEIANQLDKYYADQTSESAQWVATANLIGNLRQSNRPQAVLALFRILQIHQENPEIEKLIQQAPVTIDFETGFCDRIVPIFFDAENCTNTIGKITSAIPGKEGVLPSHHVYAAAIAVKADKINLTEELIDASNEKIWTAIIEAQILLASNDAKLAAEKLKAIKAPTGLAAWAATQYLRGIAGLQDSDSNQQSRGAILLLSVPAITKSQFPELSAACLRQVANWLKSNNKPIESRSLERELSQKYRSTFFGRASLLKNTPADKAAAETSK
jgi:hypothetical protein